MLPVCKKLLVLLWKCYILRKKNWILTLFEFACPVLVTVCAFFLNKLSTQKDDGPFGGAYEESTILNIFQYFNKHSEYPLKHLSYCAYSKNSSFENSIMEKFKTSGNFTNIPIERLDNEMELNEWLKRKTLLDKTSESIGIAFLDVNTTEMSYKYKIRSNSGNMSTKKTVDLIYSRPQVYVGSSFLLVQTFLDAELLKSSSFSFEGKNIAFGNLPTKKDTYAFAIYMMYLFMMLAYVFLVASVVREVIQEKETGIKELMKILGVSSWMIWAHWLIYTLIVQLPVTIFMAVILSVIKPIVLQTNAFVVWLLLFLFTLDCIFLLFTVSCLFNGTVRGTTIAVIGWFIVNVSTWVFVDRPGDFQFHTQLFMSLIPLTNLCWTMYTLFSFTSNGKEWNFNYLFTEGYTGSQISVGLSILIFIFETVFWALMFTFLDAVKPGPYGVAKSFKFCCAWCIKLWPKNHPKEYYFNSFRTSLPQRFEPPHQGAKVGINIRGLRKEYGLFKKVVAVESVDLNIYEGEIMALLGHNGAGKTTTMSMITGMFSATSGSILVDGKNINDKLSNFRESLGLCTQHNMYFPKLTVLEHLIFFGMLKGMSFFKAKASGLEILNLLNISDKKGFKVSKLSGGMIRRLCLAVSLIGNPKVLILDEPTSGLDPENRRQIWNIILQMRGSRTVLITTHFMEEADILGDRIAIMDHGQVVCCGTTMFLKRIYGTGYHMHILKKPNFSSDDIYTEVQNHIATFEMKLISPLQVDFVIKEGFLGKFPKLFESLEKQGRSLGITNISVTCTTLEDVFLRVADMFAEGDLENEKEDFAEKESEKSKLSSVGHVTYGPLLLSGQRFETLIWKHTIYRCRHYLSSLIKVLSSVLLVSFVVWYSHFSSHKGTISEALEINLKMYKDSISLISNDTKNYGVANISINLIKNQGDGRVLRSPQGINISEFAKARDKQDSNKYKHNTLLGLEFSNNSFTMLYQPLLKVHVPAIAVNLISNILLQNSSMGKHGKITVINHPYALPEDEKCGTTDFFRVTTPLLWMFFIFCVMVILLMDFIPFVAEERCSGFKHQQFIAGASPLSYWVCNFVCDFCTYLCMIMVCLLVFIIFGNTNNAMDWSSKWMGLTALVLILYGVSGILFLYIFSFAINSSVVCSGIFLLGNMAFALIPAVVIFLNIVQNFTIFVGLIALLSFNPTFAATICIGYISKAITEEQLCTACGETYCLMKTQSLWKIPTSEDRSGITIYIVYLGLCWILYLFLIITIEWDLFRVIFLKCFHSKKDISMQPSLEDDVKKETELVIKLKESEDTNKPLRVEALEKKYICGPKAVNMITFVVDTGECFGLLGINGAGKTSTFKILTGEILPNSGNAFVLGNSIIKKRKEYLSSIGYCPQFDALLNSLTGEETLRVIAKIRGIPHKKVKEEVDFFLSMLGIMEHAQKRTGTYSGGTKRKLSTAMAFIGNPVMVFLDEPTTGVDPVSRRKLWSVVQARQRAGQAVVLTSHSMEECEALCNRLTIMKDGQMKCIGTSEYLKQKYGRGYMVLIKLVNPTDAELERLKTTFYTWFPSSVVKDEHISLVHYQILDPSIALSKLFADMINLQKNFEIVEDFSISNTTLEQLFMSFTEDETPARRKSVFSLHRQSM